MVRVLRSGGVKTDEVTHLAAPPTTYHVSKSFILCLPFIIVVVVISLTEAGVVLVTVANFVVISFAVFDVDAIVIVEDVPL